MQPADRALQHLAVIIVNPEQQSRLVNGRPVALSEKTYPDGQICRIYNQNGAFIGIARYTAEQNVLATPENIGRRLWPSILYRRIKAGDSLPPAFSLFTTAVYVILSA